MKFQTPRGTRDFLPEQMIKRQYVIDKIRSVFEKWGFDPLETPAFEDWGLLSAKGGGGEEVKKEIYYFKDKSERELGLRFEFTVSLARVVANNPQLPKPFKRYQMGPVWRYDRPGSGRWREFWQIDADIVGSKDILADAEVVCVACNALSELGFRDFRILLNSRRLMENVFLEIGIEKERAEEAFRSIDKLKKIGIDGVEKELKDKEFPPEQIKKILISLNSCKEFKSKEVLGSLKELEDLVKIIGDFGYGKNIEIDFSLLRGLDYYTGPVFEIVIGENKQSVSGGGRYENLVQLVGGNSTPATGLALGIERIIEIMEERNMFPQKKTNTKIFVASIKSEMIDEVIKICKKLRALGISCEYDIMNRSLQKQLAYTNAKGIQYVIFVGEKEIKENVFKLKNMSSGKEFLLSLENADPIKKIISSSV